MVSSIPELLHNKISWQDSNNICFHFSNYRKDFDDTVILKDLTYLEMATLWSKRSHCRRKKVGALLIKDEQIISDGYNGTPSGSSNDCEDGNDTTYWYVIHAEMNVISKLAKNTNTSNNSTLYVTLSPCRECSKVLLQSNIKRVVFSEFYRDIEGLFFLYENGVELTYYDLK